MDDELKILIFWSYHLIMKIPEIEQRFQSTHEKRFLMHLILQHDSILTSASSEFYNSNDDTGAKYLEISGIFLFQTMLKLSCIPNVLLKRTGNSVFAYAVRPVKMGEQLIIEEQTSESNGQCDCSKCAPKWDEENNNRLILEPDYRFITQSNLMLTMPKNDFDDAEKRLVVKEKLVNLLQKYGRLPWSKTIDCLLLLLEYCMQKEYCF